MGIEVTIQLNGQGTRRIISQNPHIGTTVIGAAIRTGSLNDQSVAQISMNRSILIIAFKVQTRSCQVCFHAIADSLQVANGCRMVQHIPGSIFNGRASQAALYIGNLLAAIGQAIGGQFYLVRIRPLLRRNDNTIAIYHRSGSSCPIRKGRLRQVQFFIQRNDDGLVGRICLRGQVGVTASSNLDGTAEILLDHRCIRAVCLICAEAKAAARSRAIDNGLGHLLELVFRSRPATDDAVSLPILIIEAREVVACFRIVVVAISTICNGLIAQFSSTSSNRSEVRQVFRQFQGELAIVSILRSNNANIMGIVRRELIGIRNAAGNLYILVQQHCGRTRIATVVHTVAQRSKGLLRIRITIDRVREARRRVTLFLQILGTAVVLIQGRILISQSHAERTVTAVNFHIVTALTCNMEIAIIAIICAFRCVRLAQIDLIIHLHRNHAVIINVGSQVICRISMTGLCIGSTNGNGIAQAAFDTLVRSAICRLGISFQFQSLIHSGLAGQILQCNGL